MRRMKLGRSALLLCVLICACQQAPAPKPVAIAYGKDICGTCDDVIKDRRFAAEYIMAGDAVKKFDDPGCLFRALRNEPNAPGAVYFQHVDKEEWVGDKQVWLATTPRIASTQGYNWAAYGSFAEAQDAVASAGGGQILPFAQAKERIASVIPTPAPAHRPTEALSELPTEPSDS
jgi:hypothetical protein